MPTTWTAGLAPWYAAHGRHDLPWRQTRDAWAVLVSEVMLQQTQVPRVVPYWQEFMSRWPDPGSFAAAPLPDVLRAWQGLGYPRRAVALHDTAALVAAGGWPRDEPGLQKLPGIGRYTSRALLTLALAEPSAPPLDVNIARVAARAGAGREPGDVSDRTLEELITLARPSSLDRRRYTFALFDTGALHCRAQPRCAGCPLRRGCAWRRRRNGEATTDGSDRATARRARRPSVPYPASMRLLRGVLLAAALHEGGDLTPEAAHAAAAAVAEHLPLARDPARVDQALASLRADRLIGR
jgi:A/G-specific adenine glycosylase